MFKASKGGFKARKGGGGGIIVSAYLVKGLATLIIFNFWKAVIVFPIIIIKAL